MSKPLKAALVTGPAVLDNAGKCREDAQQGGTSIRPLNLRGTDEQPNRLTALLDELIAAARKDARQLNRIMKLIRHENSARRIGNQAEAEAFKAKWEKLAAELRSRRTK